MEDEEAILKARLDQSEDFDERQQLRKRIREIRKKKFEEDLRAAEQKLLSGPSTTTRSSIRDSYRDTTTTTATRTVPENDDDNDEYGLREFTTEGALHDLLNMTPFSETDKRRKIRQRMREVRDEKIDKMSAITRRGSSEVKTELVRTSSRDRKSSHEASDLSPRRTSQELGRKSSTELGRRSSQELRSRSPQDPGKRLSVELSDRSPQDVEQKSPRELGRRSSVEPARSPTPDGNRRPSQDRHRRTSSERGRKASYEAIRKRSQELARKQSQDRGRKPSLEPIRRPFQESIRRLSKERENSLNEGEPVSPGVVKSPPMSPSAVITPPRSPGMISPNTVKSPPRSPNVAFSGKTPPLSPNDVGKPPSSPSNVKTPLLRLLSPSKTKSPETAKKTDTGTATQTLIDNKSSSDIGSLKSPSKKQPIEKERKKPPEPVKKPATESVGKPEPIKKSASAPETSKKSSAEPMKSPIDKTQSTPSLTLDKTPSSTVEKITPVQRRIKSRDETPARPLSHAGDSSGTLASRRLRNREEAGAALNLERPLQQTGEQIDFRNVLKRTTSTPTDLPGVKVGKEVKSGTARKKDADAIEQIDFRHVLKKKMGDGDGGATKQADGGSPFSTDEFRSQVRIKVAAKKSTEGGGRKDSSAEAKSKEPQITATPSSSPVEKPNEVAAEGKAEAITERKRESPSIPETKQTDETKEGGDVDEEEFEGAVRSKTNSRSQDKRKKKGSKKGEGD